jgi:hypothetical protein
VVFRAAVEDLAGELVAEHDPLVTGHEPVVSGLVEHVGEFVAVMAGVQVGAADPAAPRLDEHLPLVRF